MRLSLSLIALAGLAVAAHADDAALQAQVFGRALGADTGYACFTRLYSKDHLASHKHQNVTSTMLLLKSVSNTGDAGRRYTAGVDFRFRHSNKHFQAYGECPSIASEGSSAEAGTLHCGIECDGGSINVSLKDENTILVKLPDGIAVSEGGDEPSSSRFGSDDKVFKLSRAKPTACLSLALDDDEKAALKKLK